MESANQPWQQGGICIEARMDRSMRASAYCMRQHSGGATAAQSENWQRSPRAVRDKSRAISLSVSPNPHMRIGTRQATPQGVGVTCRRHQGRHMPFLRHAGGGEALPRTGKSNESSAVMRITLLETDSAAGHRRFESDDSEKENAQSPAPAGTTRTSFARDTRRPAIRGGRQRGCAVGRARRSVGSGRHGSRRRGYHARPGPFPAGRRRRLLRQAARWRVRIRTARGCFPGRACAWRRSSAC